MREGEFRHHTDTTTYGKTNAQKKKTPKSQNSDLAYVYGIIFISLRGTLFVFMSKPSIQVESVSYGSIDVPKTLNGIIVRDEYVVTSNMEGQPVYYYSENEKVQKSAAVCSIRNSDTTKLIEEEMQKIDEDIVAIQKNRTDISIFQEDIERISSNISNAVDAYAYKFINGNMEDVYTLRTKLQSEIDLRNNIWLTENTRSISDLTAQRSQYESQLENNTSVLNATDGGILSFRVDGFEDILTPDTLDQVTQEQVKMTIQPESISRNLAVEVDDPFLKS